MSLLIHMLITSCVAWEEWKWYAIPSILACITYPHVIEKHMLCQSWDTQTNGPSLRHLDSRLWKVGM